MRSLIVKNFEYLLPIYIPDATLGFVKSLDSADLANTKTEGVVVNTYHLMNTPGTQTLQKIGGIKNFMNFHGLVVSDSGGWQIFSLIHKSKLGEITNDGVLFSASSAKKEIFTPEKSIQTQFAIGADIIICLDYFTNPRLKHRKHKTKRR